MLDFQRGLQLNEGEHDYAVEIGRRVVDGMDEPVADDIPETSVNGTDEAITDGADESVVDGVALSEVTNLAELVVIFHMLEEEYVEFP